MKVPDKIYIHPNYEPSGGWITTETREYQPDDVWETEYIRKEALLEWAKELKEKWEEPPMSKHSPGCVFMLEQLINKLNSM